MSTDWITNRVRELREQGIFIDDTHHYVMVYEKGWWSCGALLNNDEDRYTYVEWCMAQNIAPFFEARKDPRNTVVIGVILTVDVAMAWRMRWT